MDKRSHKQRWIILALFCGLFLNGCAFVSYVWYTQQDRSIKLSVKAGNVQRMLVIANVSQKEAAELKEEQALFEELGVNDYFEIQQHPEAFFLVHYTNPGKGGVVFYNFNFTVSQFDPSEETTAAILEHFGLSETCDPRTQKMKLDSLLAAQTFPYHELFESGDVQKLKEPNWYEERWK